MITWVQGFPDSSVGKESTCNSGEPSSIPGSGRSAGEGMGYPLQYSWASLVAQLVKNLPAMQTGFNPWVGKIPWRRERPLTPEFWPGEFHRLYSPWGHKEPDTTKQLSLSLSYWSLVSAFFHCSKTLSRLSFNKYLFYTSCPSQRKKLWTHPTSGGEDHWAKWRKRREAGGMLEWWGQGLRNQCNLNRVS